MSEIERINQSGFANGWHAQQLQTKAKNMGITMASAFSMSISTSSGFNVPAKCIKATNVKVTYEFQDKSTITLNKPN